MRSFALRESRKEERSAERSFNTADAVSPRRTRCLRSAWIEGSDFCGPVGESQNPVMRSQTYLVQPAGKRILCSWCGTEHLPVVDCEFMATRRGLALWDDLKCARELDSGLESQSERVVSLCL